MVVSVTRLRVRSLKYLLPFLLASHRVGRQARASAGFMGGKLLLDRRWTFWTLTGWTNDASMRTFRSSGVHAEVMPKLAHWCNEAAVAHWEHAGVELPTWEEAS